MATSLHTKGFISDDTLEKINTLKSETNTDKARCLYSAILRVVGEYPHKYADFVDTLKNNAILHGDLLAVLQDTYQKNSTLIIIDIFRGYICR